MRQWGKAVTCSRQAVCSRTLLMQPTTSGKQLTACMPANGQQFKHLLLTSRETQKESWATKVKLTWFILNKMFLCWWLCNFQMLKVYQNKARTLNKWGRKIPTHPLWHILLVIFVQIITGIWLLLLNYRWWMSNILFETVYCSN